MKNFKNLLLSLLITLMFSCFLALVGILGHLIISNFEGSKSNLSKEEFQELNNIAIKDAEEKAALSIDKYLKAHELTKNSDNMTRYLMKETMYAYASSYGINFHKEPLLDNTITSDEEYNEYKSSLNKEYGSFSADWEYFESYSGFDDSCSTDDKSYFIYCASLIPNNLLYKMLDDGWRFELVNEIDTENNPLNEKYHTEGCTFWKDKLICVDKDSDVRGTLLHEVGHVLAKGYGFEKKCLENNISSYDNPALYDTYNHFHPNGELYIYWNYDEGLADFFAEYICYPKELRNSSPILYSCYERALANL